MTPKDKAVELINKMYYTQSSPTYWVQAKECALLAVDNIILANPHSNPFNTDVYSTMEYWLEVKKEIEKL